MSHCVREGERDGGGGTVASTHSDTQTHTHTPTHMGGDLQLMVVLTKSMVACETGPWVFPMQYYMIMCLCVSVCVYG